MAEATATTESGYQAIFAAFFVGAFPRRKPTTSQSSNYIKISWRTLMGSIKSRSVLDKDSLIFIERNIGDGEADFDN
jgi:hypothetical protein